MNLFLCLFFICLTFLFIEVLKILKYEIKYIPLVVFGTGIIYAITVFIFGVGDTFFDVLLCLMCSLTACGIYDIYLLIKEKLTD